MKHIGTILVGVDFTGDDGALSPGSLAAVRQALWLAGGAHARVDLLHSTYVADEDEEPPACGPRDSLGPELVELLREHGLRPDEVGWLLSEERPWIALTRRVLAGDADLVVVAKRSRFPREDRRLGSVSVRLLRKCPGPVWVVRPAHELRHRSILAATDLTPVGDLAVEHGVWLARAEDCDLIVVHAWQVPFELQMRASRMREEDVAAERRAIAEAALEHVRSVPGVAELGDRARVFLANDAPSHALLQVVAERNPDLVVMGTISRGGVVGLLVGNTAEKVLHRLDCSILAVKPDDFVCPLQPEA